jgi:hypothetical protein
MHRELLAIKPDAGGEVKAGVVTLALLLQRKRGKRLVQSEKRKMQNAKLVGAAFDSFKLCTLHLSLCTFPRAMRRYGDSRSIFHKVSG